MMGDGGNSQFVHQAEGMARRKRSRILCTGCSFDCDAEYVHIYLQVPICGWCNRFVTERLSKGSQRSSADSTTSPLENEHVCLWCGSDDDRNLFLCDSCPRSVCSACVKRNFGVEEANRVKNAEIWQCYCCVPTTAFERLQVARESEFFSVDKAFSQLRPPNDVRLDNIENTEEYRQLSFGERRLLSLFVDVEGVPVMTMFHIENFLAAPDIAKLRLVSSRINKLLSRLRLTPGLFQTIFGEEHACRLFPHQHNSLAKMLTKENEIGRFGALRGGILADSPGLGKTVTLLALVATTAGAMPRQPSDPFKPEKTTKNSLDEDAIDAEWAELCFNPQSNRQLLTIINSIERNAMLEQASSGAPTGASDFAFHAELSRWRKQLEAVSGLNGREVSSFSFRGVKFVRNAGNFAKLGRLIIQNHVHLSPISKSTVAESLRLDLLQLQESSQRQSRALLSSKTYMRFLAERRLRPSGATLIVVPLTLVEHWYEQILRHLNLEYFVRSAGRPLANGRSRQDTVDISESGIPRGVAYIDGLGDVADITAPLPRLQVTPQCPITPAQLAEYLIVVIPMEKCAILQRRDVELGLLSGDANSSTTSFSEAGKISGASNPFGAIRWLRIVVDEGHELGGSGNFDRLRRQSPSSQTNEQPAASIAVPLTDMTQLPENSVVGLHPIAVPVETGSSVVAETNVQQPVATQTLTTTTPRRKKAENHYLEHAGAFVCQLACERRWIVSGTPTRGTSSSVALEQIYRLLVFLRHDYFVTASSNVPPYVIDSPEAAPVPASSQMNYFSSQAVTLSGRKRTVSSRHDSLLISNVSPSVAEGRNVGRQRWENDIARPFVSRQKAGWEAFNQLLDGLVARNTKDQLKLYPPIRKMVTLEHSPTFQLQQTGLNSDDAEVQRSIRLVDFTIAEFIANEIFRAKERWQGVIGKSHRGSDQPTPSILSPNVAQSQTMRRLHSSEDASLDDYVDKRRPKAIVYSSHETDLQGVAHYLYQLMGEQEVCEHWGMFRSTELGRFRHSRKKFRLCPMCGYQCSVTDGAECSRVLLLVQYDLEENGPVGVNDWPPAEGGHGGRGPGGPFRGRCLCSPAGCPVGVQCTGFPNPFFRVHRQFGGREGAFNKALVAEEHIVGFVPGQSWFVGQPVTVRTHAGASSDEGESEVRHPLLWRQGRLGGRATVVGWKRCGGRNGWHGDKVLKSVPWTIEHQDASVLLLARDGSTGLDLSFATHIFLLESITDPAIENQVISRAHRMGSTGPVEVTLVSVRE